MWGLDEKGNSWATGGYAGAIGSGQTTCGLLIGSSIAVGFRYGQDKEGIPTEHEADRTKAIQAVGKLYDDFLEEFGSTQCQTLTGVDFSKPEDRERYRNNKIGQDKCEVFFSFVMNRFIELTKKRKTSSSAS